MIKAIMALAMLTHVCAYAKATSYNIEESQKRCTTHYSQSKTLYSNEFSWGMTPQSMAQKFDDIYKSDLRLDYHAQYDKNKKSFILFMPHNKKVFPIPVTETFIKSVTQQVEVALKEGFAEHIFFPDMGHSHLHFPEAHWDIHYKNDNPSEPIEVRKVKLYTAMLADPKMKPLYHLAEQLQMTDADHNVLKDPYIEFRYWNRNFVGRNDGSTTYDIYVEKNKKYNTVGRIDGHKSYSAGFNISASEKGCFPYTDRDGKTRYFDISLKDVEPDPSIPMDDFGF